MWRHCPGRRRRRKGRKRYQDEFRASLRRLGTLDVERVIVSHGEPVLTQGVRPILEALEAPGLGRALARALPPRDSLKVTANLQLRSRGVLCRVPLRDARIPSLIIRNKEP